MKTILSLVLLATVAVVDTLPAQAQSFQPLQGVEAIAQTTPMVSQAEEFVSLLADGEFNQALQKYDGIARENITSETLETTWQDLVDKSGDFQEVVSSETVPGEGQDMVLLTTRFEQDTVVLFVIFDGEQEINSFTY
ncbi:DUF3887 domain-containing protein [Phormidium pseudopriestleyi FRX01]|uniref:DUF3887 domain-containing protein n=1 Tax=Phormidium pseudopriestleyi FRX01 TaxID=1759528 RepID=A0ABS3FMC9_9CYAN|nr:DUF3887 domain-containing protein [Phormidium pseudopriestleyi]MBO0348193.1 DUF3887 domain-containing protein [Phormidium pseudopriestleyi FRX01]